MRLSLRTRILAAFVLSFSLFLGALGYGTYQLRSLGDGLQVVNRGYLPLARIAAQLSSHQDRIDLDAARLQRDSERPLAAFRSNADFHAGEISELVQQGHSTALQALEQVRSVEERRALEAVLGQLDRLGSLAGDYERSSHDWIELAAGGDEQAILTAQAELLQRQQALQTVVEQLNTTLDAGIRRVNDRVTRTQARATMVGGGLAGLALAFGAAMLAWTLLTLRPIGHLTAQVQRIAAGDYSGRVDVQSSDEIGVLATEFNTMARTLAERDRRLVERAEQLKRLSGYLRSVLDTIRLGLVVVEQGQVTMANPAAAQLWGVRDDSPLPAELAALGAGRHPALGLGALIFDLEVVPFGAAGSLVVGEDITQRLRDQERLERSERLALIGQMLAQVTHEVRNPLNAISLNAELLAEELQAASELAEASDILSIIVREIHRLEQVTEHYLDMARRPAPRFEAEDMGELVQSVCRLEEPAFEKAQVRLAYDGPEGPLRVPVDGNQLRRALLNVLRNALQSGADEVTVGLHAEQDQVVVEVSDNGRGTDPENLARIFDPFFSRRTKGTGLGLAITRQIMDDHGGSVLVESEPERGFRIALSLPK